MVIGNIYTKGQRRSTTVKESQRRSKKVKASQLTRSNLISFRLDWEEVAKVNQQACTWWKSIYTSLFFSRLVFSFLFFSTFPHSFHFISFYFILFHFSYDLKQTFLIHKGQNKYEFVCRRMRVMSEQQFNK